MKLEIWVYPIFLIDETKKRKKKDWRIKIQELLTLIKFIFLPRIKSLELL